MMLRRLRHWPGIRRRQLRFVLLHHLATGRDPHFDLLLELRPGRKLWDLETKKDPRAAYTPIIWRRHGLHRRRYLNYEGDLGNGRGIVKRLDCGTYSVRAKRGVLHIDLQGDHWRSVFALGQSRSGAIVWHTLRIGGGSTQVR